MFKIQMKDFEKVAISLSNISKNIDASDVAGVFVSDEPLGDRFRNAVVDKLKDNIQDSIRNELNSDDPNVDYQQPKLKIQKMQKFRFKKVAENVIPSVLRAPLESIGISSEERGYLIGKLKSAIKHTVKSEAYGESENADQSRYAQRGGAEHVRSGTQGFTQGNQNRKAVQIIGQHGFGGQQVFLA